jgi:hypothetical protein
MDVLPLVHLWLAEWKGIKKDKSIISRGLHQSISITLIRKPRAEREQKTKTKTKKKRAGFSSGFQ